MRSVLSGILGCILLLLGCNRKEPNPANAEDPLAYLFGKPAPKAPQVKLAEPHSNVPLAQPDQVGEVPPEFGGGLAAWGKLVDPANDCQISFQGNKLTMIVPPGLHDINQSLGGMTAPRMLQAVEGDFLLQVKVTGDFTPGPEPFQRGVSSFNGAGLSLWLDEENYLRLERNAWWNPSERRYQCYTPLYSIFVDGKSQPTDPGIGSTNFFQGRSTWFRLEREGRFLITSYSHDGKNWNLVPRLASTFPKKVYVGVGAVSTSAQPFKVEFEDFQLVRKGDRPAR